jgi:hypothetical protein
VPLHYRHRLFAEHERSFAGEGSATPRPGTTFGTGFTLDWDRYTLRDLAPSGFVISLDGSAGIFLPTVKPRLVGKASAVAAFAPTETTVIKGQLVGQVVSAGNPNHSVLLDSRGVRGLEDAFYRNQSQLVANLELRQAWRFAERWAVQGVLFGDGALFRQLDALGRPARILETAGGVGAGARIIPTSLAGLLFRFDVARLLLPERRWFFQFGLGQYF